MSKEVRLSLRIPARTQKTSRGYRVKIEKFEKIECVTACVGLSNVSRRHSNVLPKCLTDSNAGDGRAAVACHPAVAPDNPSALDPDKRLNESVKRLNQLRTWMMGRAGIRPASSRTSSQKFRVFLFFPIFPNVFLSSWCG